MRLIDTNGKVHRVEEISGKDVNTILEDILGTSARRAELQAKLDELARRIDDGRLELGS